MTLVGQHLGKAGSTHPAQPLCCSARSLVELGLGASSCLHHRYPGAGGLSKAAIRGQGPTVETCTAQRPACGCRSLPLNEREVTLVMNIFQRGSPVPLAPSKTPRQRGRTLLGDGGTQGASPGNRGCYRPPRPPQQLLLWFYWLLSRAVLCPQRKSAHCFTLWPYICMGSFRNVLSIQYPSCKSAHLYSPSSLVSRLNVLIKVG